MGLGVCGSVALGVSKVRGSAGMGAWRVWGSEGLLGRRCEEKGRTESAGPNRAFRRFSEVPSTTNSTFMVLAILEAVRGRFRDHVRNLFKTILGEKSGHGDQRPQKSVQEILRGSQYDQKYSFF